jgi:hypothetical protein
MPFFYFEIEQTLKGWLIIESENLEDATADISSDGFDADGIDRSESSCNITIVYGGALVE